MTNYLRLALFAALGALMCATGLTAQTIHPEMRNRAYPGDSNGLPVGRVMVLVSNSDGTVVADSTHEATLRQHFGMHPGATFNANVMAAAMRNLIKEPSVKTASYTLYHSAPSAPLTVVVDVTMLAEGEHKDYNGRSGMAASGSLRDFPLVFENKHFEVSAIVNAGVGLYDDVDAYFGHGDVVLADDGNATDPADKGSRFWGEMSLELGARANLQLGNSNVYAFGAVSGMLTARNASDISNKGAKAYVDVEKLFGGLLFTHLGSGRDMTLRLSYGRQDFQLNDGFLISKWSGSANSNGRASNYMLARTAFARMGLAKLTTLRWAVEVFYLEPDEEHRRHTDHTQYLGTYVGYNDNRHLNLGIAYIDRVAGNGTYDLGPDRQPLAKRGMYVINPKVWVDNIAGTPLFFRGEYAFEGHRHGGMAANAWYAGLGLNMVRTPLMPRIYYRYCYQQGDNGQSGTYHRFDHVLSGGLAEWVQGVTMIKLFTRGNVITHRLQVQIHPTRSLDVIATYHHYRADKRWNVGDNDIFDHLATKHLGDEFTLQTDYNINSHFLLMGILSLTRPGSAIRAALPAPARCWSTFELSCFMFF